MTTRTYNRSNQERLHHFVDQLVADYSKLLVVRLDLYIGNEYAEINTYEYMNEAFIRLRNNLRFNQLFDHYITYAAKLEYGVDRRWHYHVVFFYDGQKVKNDYLLAQALGKYWVDTITRGLGSYYSANMNSDKYKAFALGMIDYRELRRIEKLKVVLDYLVKEEAGEPVRLDAAGKAYRSYRQGLYKPRDSRLGRPRVA
ncbi:YagK/YfjJ domain-containing protein [Paenalcaligenes hermetiae]|uniref:YagK/YfjJ C-terminal domain-containing protein n=1 Tax=Paenalcaligenes hermetiae TaxID=1157987 RepID=A0ABP9LV87_9BURK